MEEYPVSIISITHCPESGINQWFGFYKGRPYFISHSGHRWKNEGIGIKDGLPYCYHTGDNFRTIASTLSMYRFASIGWHEPLPKEIQYKVVTSRNGAPALYSIKE